RAGRGLARWPIASRVTWRFLSAPRGSHQTDWPVLRSKACSRVVSMAMYAEPPVCTRDRGLNRATTSVPPSSVSRPIAPSSGCGIDLADLLEHDLGHRASPDFLDLSLLCGAGFCAARNSSWVCIGSAWVCATHWVCVATRLMVAAPSPRWPEARQKCNEKEEMLTRSPNTERPIWVKH